MRFLRFSYIVPRMVLLVLLLLATEVGSGYLIRWGIVSSGEATIGAKVEVASAKSSLLDTRVLVRDLAIANPHSPLRNLVKADRIEVDLNASALLRKKLVADYAVISGLEFDTQRTTSGELPEVLDSPAEDSTPGWFRPQAEEYGAAWLSDLEERLGKDLQEQFESVRVAEELSKRWPEKYRELESQAKAIKTQAKQLQQDVSTAKQNPLRHVDFLAEVPSRVKALESSIRELKTQVAALPDQLASDRARVAAARQHDEELIREQLQIGEVDGQQLTDYLLGEKLSGPLHQTLAWIRWARKLAPPRGQKIVRSTAERGENILFAGSQPIPDVLLKAARVQGTARVAGQPMELIGVVRDWTNQPELHAKPTTLEFTTRGGLPLTIEATLDRTRPTPTDEIYCTTSDLLLPAQAFGKQDKLQVSVAPSKAAVTLDIKLEGEAIEGRVEIAQSDIQLTPTLAAGAVGTRLQSAVASQLTDVDSANTTLLLTGTLDAPQAELQSTLGPALATAIKQSTVEVATVERDRLLAKAQQTTDAHLAKLDQQFAAFQNRIANDLEGPAQIAGNLLGTGSDTQLGRSPFGQLFK